MDVFTSTYLTMLKLTKLNLIVCAVVVATAWLCISAYDIYWGWVYELDRSPARAINTLQQLGDVILNPPWFIRCYWNQFFLQGITNLIVGCALAISIRALKRTHKPYNFEYAQCLLKDIFKERPYKKYVFWLGLSVINCVALAGTLNCLQMVKHYGLRDTAYILDGLGQYEIGEQIFSLTTEGCGITLASTCGFSGHDADRAEVANERLNNTVARIYGENSIELAHRLQTQAGRIVNNFEDYSLAIQTRTRAIAIFKRAGRLDRCADNFGFLAYDLQASGNIAEAKRTISEALKYANSSQTSLEERKEVLSSLYSAVYSMGDQKLAEEILSVTGGEMVLPTPLNVDNSDSILFVCGLLFTALTVLATTINLKGHPNDRLTNRWVRELQNSPTDELRAASLRRLINLEMFRRNLPAADEYSKQLLRIYHDQG